MCCGKATKRLRFLYAKLHQRKFHCLAQPLSEQKQQSNRQSRRCDAEAP
jgi:hypothetical protein